MKGKNKFKPVLIFFGVLALTVILGSAIIPAPNPARNDSIGWGDNGGGRESHTIKEVSSGILGDSIVFNTISDGKIGNEKNFVSARLDNETNTGNGWNGNEISVKDGAVYLIRIYVHNNSPLGYNAVAENVKVAFSIPTVSAKTIPVNGFIFCSNAIPSEYWDGVVFTSDNFFHLEYIYESAILENGGIGTNGLKLSDEIVTKAASNNGTIIGYDSLDGNIPGGEQYASYIIIKVKVVFDVNYKVETKVRSVGIAGSDSWGSQVEAQIGDEVEFQIEYTNTDENTQENVMIKNILPSNLEYVAGSTKIYNTNYPAGASVDQDDVVTTGINIGNYAPGANAYIRFTAKVIDVNLEEDSNTLVNWSQCGVGEATIQDHAMVQVNKN